MKGIKKKAYIDDNSLTENSQLEHLFLVNIVFFRKMSAGIIRGRTLV